MNARAATLSVVLFALFVVLAPTVFAGTCVIAGDQCFNTTQTTAGGGQTLITGDPRIAASASVNACAAAGGTWYENEALNTVNVCKTACCCDPRKVTPAQIKSPANACTPGMAQRDMLPSDPTCSATCETSVTTLPPQCAEGTITAADCACGNVPVTQADVNVHVCCWNGQIANNINACPAKPSNYCKLNEPLNSACQCGPIQVSNGVCCTGSIHKNNLTSCPATPPPINGSICGNLIKEGSEACDATQSFVNNVLKVNGAACADPNQICTTTCSCQTIKNAVCGDKVCDATETTASCATDCPASPTCQPIAGQYPAPLEFKAAWNEATEQVSLSWKHPNTCDVNRGGYRLQHSNTSIADAIAKPNGIQYLDKDVNATVDNVTVDTKVLYYVLYTTYDNGVNVGKAEITLPIPNKLCPGGIVSYCASATYGVNCNGYEVVSVADCTDDSEVDGHAQICTLRTGEATCEIASNQCDECNGLFNMFPNDDKIIREGNNNVQCSQAITCYKDLGHASTELYKSCSEVSSCGSYRSEAACEDNSCSIGDQSECEWNVYDGLGYCRATNEELRECEDCKIENGCVADICKAVGGDQCYFYDPENGVPARDDMPPGCYDPDDMVCEMYTTEDDCTGGTEFRLNTAYNGIIRVSGDNRVITSSNDAAGLGKCQWLPAAQGGRCVRDANDDSAADLGNNAPLHQLQDFTNPASAVLGSPNAVYPRNFVVQYTSETTESYQCIARPGDACYPSKDNRQGTQVRWSFDNPEDNGVWALRHYSVDLSKNLEYVREFLFRIDTRGPTITVQINQTTYPFNNNASRTHAAVRIDVSEPSTCTTQLLTQQGSSIPGIRELQQVFNRPQGVFGQNFSYNYPELNDGQFALRVNCIDSSLNNNSIVHNFAVDTNAEITKPRPMGRTPPLNITTVNIGVETAQPASCRYGPRGTNFAQMTPYSVTGTRNHSATVNVGSGEFRYQSACDFGGVVIYGDQNDDVIFSVDMLAPNVVLCNAATTNANADDCTATPFINHASQQHRVALRCADRPGTSPSFGCDRTKIFSCIENVRGPACTPVMSDLQEANFDKTPKRIRYYAIDRGGARGIEQTTALNLTDTTPPVLEFKLE